MVRAFISEGGFLDPKFCAVFPVIAYGSKHLKVMSEKVYFLHS